MRYRESKEVEILDADEYWLLWRWIAKGLLHEEPQESEKKLHEIVEKNVQDDPLSEWHLTKGRPHESRKQGLF